MCRRLEGQGRPSRSDASQTSHSRPVGQWVDRRGMRCGVCKRAEEYVFAACPPIAMQEKKVRSLLVTLGVGKQCRRGGPESRKGSQAREKAGADVPVRLN